MGITVGLGVTGLAPDGGVGDGTRDLAVAREKKNVVYQTVCQIWLCHCVVTSFSVYACYMYL